MVMGGDKGEVGTGYPRARVRSLGLSQFACRSSGRLMRTYLIIICGSDFTVESCISFNGVNKRRHDMMQWIPVALRGLHCPLA